MKRHSEPFVTPVLIYRRAVRTRRKIIPALWRCRFWSMGKWSPERFLQCESPLLALTGGSRRHSKMSAMEAKPDGRRTRPEPTLLTGC